MCPVAQCPLFTRTRCPRGVFYFQSNLLQWPSLPIVGTLGKFGPCAIKGPVLESHGFVVVQH